MIVLAKASAMDVQHAQNYARVCKWLDQLPRLFENVLADPPVVHNDEDDYSAFGWSYY